MIAEQSRITRHPGDGVHIISQTMNGQFVVEGCATIVSALDAENERYLVDFGDEYGPVERYVDPGAQDNPHEFVRSLNESIRQKSEPHGS